MITRTSTYNRVLLTITCIAVLFHAYVSHYENLATVTAMTNHQQHSIEAFSKINEAIASGILKRVEATVDRDQAQAELRAQPTPTPSVITKTKIKTKYIRRPSPTPFRWFRSK